MLLWALATAAAGLVLVDRAAVFTLRPRPSGPGALTRARDLGLAARDVEFDSGGVTLRGEWLAPASEKPGRPLLILAHGWTGSAGVMLRVARPFVRAGYPALVFDVRSHGRSERAPAVTVRHFRDDLMRAVEFAAETDPERPRVVLGHSLGGAAAVLAVASGARIDGLALVAAPADLFEVTAGFYDDFGLPGRLVTRALTPSWRLRAGESFRHLDPESAARRVSLPTVIVQGDADTRVPPDQAARLGRALGAGVRLVSGAGHKDVLQRPEFVEAVRGLLAQVEAIRLTTA